MDNKAIIKFCKDSGCCDACCLRYIGLRNPNVYENSQKFMLKYEEPSDEPAAPTDTPPQEPVDTNGSSSPPAKRRRAEPCISCLGLLQEDTWSQCYEMVKETLDKKGYSCSRFACALSAPSATLLREKALTLSLADTFKHYEPDSLTPLKEAWKWSFGVKLSAYIGKPLDSGAVCPLLITLHMEYPDDMQELEILKTLSPSLFESRSQQRKRFKVEFTRRSVEQALDGVTLDALRALEGWRAPPAPPPATARVRCVSVQCVHAPLYLGGRYVKLSRELPQTPWLVSGARVLDSSVQEIIFAPLADLYRWSPAEAEHRLKFMSAGREDVDVRCLGDGRPFAIEITDPRRELTAEELRRACELISGGGKVLVRSMLPVTREQLAELKRGEESKSKTYEALCVKLSHSHERDPGPGQAGGDAPVAVTAADIEAINSFSNAPAGDPACARILLQQKTPIRVLHRRPLLARTRRILELSAEPVPDHPCLLLLRVRTEAGTYVKEWVHGELGRSRPALGDALAPGAPQPRLDILALDVTRVHLDWPTQLTK